MALKAIIITSPVEWSDATR